MTLNLLNDNSARHSVDDVSVSDFEIVVAKQDDCGQRTDFIVPSRTMVCMLEPLTTTHPCQTLIRTPYTHHSNEPHYRKRASKIGV